MRTPRITRLDIEDLLVALQDDCEVSHLLQIDTDDAMDERPIYCVWTLKLCQTPEAFEPRLHLEVVEPYEMDTWTVTSYWENDTFPYGNCPLQYLAAAVQVIDLDWRLDVLRNHRELADTLEISYLPATVQ